MIQFDMVTMNYPKSFNVVGKLAPYSVVNCGRQGWTVIRTMDAGHPTPILFSIACKVRAESKGWDTEGEAQGIADILNSTILGG